MHYEMRLIQRKSTRGFTLIEVLIVLAILLLLLSVAIPSAINAHRNAVETVVMREVQTISQAQIQYQSQFGDFAATLAQLGPPANGVSGPAGAALIPPSLASGEKDGYIFMVSKTAAGFSINANPKTFPKNGRRTFYLDQDGILHQNWGPDPATANSPDVK
jgi:type IV pilus assembly protein PilA